jgi:hypothetical protein
MGGAVSSHFTIVNAAPSQAALRPSRARSSQPTTAASDGSKGPSSPGPPSRSRAAASRPSRARSLQPTTAASDRTQSPSSPGPPSRSQAAVLLSRQAQNMML